MKFYSFFESNHHIEKVQVELTLLPGLPIEKVQVELTLLPGLPNLHVVGLPDTHLRECSLRIRSAFSAHGFSWPRGHQVIVNLRPSYVRKQSRGLEGAIALALLHATGQIRLPWKDHDIFMYADLGLDGSMSCPEDFWGRDMRPHEVLLLGQGHPRIQDCFEVRALGDFREKLSFVKKDPEAFSMTPPPVPDLYFSPVTAEALELAALMRAPTLLAGPPGTGKSTWARALYHLLPPLTEGEQTELRRNAIRFHQPVDWRPFIAPHHTIPAISMVGGGVPPFPGEIAKAHGGILLMDEFLEFHPRVLEALREPVESKKLRISRQGRSFEWPVDFLFVATTNLCPCGELVPGRPSRCGRSLRSCRSTWERLSGPMMDRFEVILFTGGWSGNRSVSLASLAEQMPELRRQQQALKETPAPRVLVEGQSSHRRMRALLRAAKAYAALDGADRIGLEHWQKASDFTRKPQEALRQLFA